MNPTLSGSRNLLDCLFRWRCHRLFNPSPAGTRSSIHDSERRHRTGVPGAAAALGWPGLRASVILPVIAARKEARDPPTRCRRSITIHHLRCMAFDPFTIYQFSASDHPSLSWRLACSGETCCGNQTAVDSWSRLSHSSTPGKGHLDYIHDPS